MTILFATVGNPIVIVCDIQWSSKSPNWYYKNTPITTEAAYTISNQQLTIANAQLSLSGEYTCTASNEYGNSERQFLLVVGSEFKLIPTIIKCRHFWLTTSSDTFYSNGLFSYM